MSIDLDVVTWTAEVFCPPCSFGVSWRPGIARFRLDGFLVERRSIRIGRLVPVVSRVTLAHVGFEEIAAMPLDRSASPPVIGVRAPPEPLGLWRAWRAARRNVLEIIPQDAYRLPALSGGGRPGWIMIMDPPALEKVLKTREAAYPKSAVTRRIMKPRRGENLITATGETWRWQRRAMSAPFAPGALDASRPAMAAAGRATAERLAASAPGVIDVYPRMTAATADVIADIALSGREALDRKALTDTIDAFVARVARISLFDLMGVPGWVPRPGELLDGARARMDRRADEIIAARRAAGASDPPDFLDLLTTARDPQTGQGLSDIDLRNNLLGFLFAGHETTALTLTWALYLLALHPDVQARAADAADASAEDRLDPWLRQVLEETLRLFPPAGFLARTALDADELSGHDVRPGTAVILPIYAMHRSARLWPDPDRFDPERFSPEAKAARHRFAWLPFGAGPRVCIGSAMALEEAGILLAQILRRARLSVPEGFVPEPRMWFTLRPASGMPLRLDPR